MRILLYGSTFVSEQVEALLMKHHEIVGHYPSINPGFTGRGMKSRVVPSGEPQSYDIALSVQYDRKITLLADAYNLHTGLLPDWGGCDILYHTLDLRAVEQGLTFHKMTDKFDAGGIVATTTYPVFYGDRIVDLYRRVVALAPGFALASIALLSAVPLKALRAQNPRTFRRGQVTDPYAYVTAAEDIREYIRRAQ